MMTNKPKVILRINTVVARTGKARSTLYLDIANNRFPKPIKLGDRSVGWLESDVEEWIDKCIQQSNHGGA